MKLEKIVTLASAAVRLRFVAMERSLRGTGCKLPLLVIPYDAARFDLPSGARWLEIPELERWLAARKAHPTMRKYQCLLESNYQFVDADVCFLRNPEEVLAGQHGFVTCCGHWHNPGDTVTPDSLRWMRARSTTWPRWAFNTGQFACEPALFTLDELKGRAAEPDFRQACLEWPFHEQPGLNQLVIASGVKVTNLTLPPLCMESTWAGDYPDTRYRQFWASEERKPYLIHWAGLNMSRPRPIDEVFYSYLTEAEKGEWRNQAKIRRVGPISASLQRARASVRAAVRAWHKS